jgi:hypothetical protein
MKSQPVCLLCAFFYAGQGISEQISGLFKSKVLKRQYGVTDVPYLIEARHPRREQG